jgi:hypothetical protein
MSGTSKVLVENSCFIFLSLLFDSCFTAALQQLSARTLGRHFIALLLASSTIAQHSNPPVAEAKKKIKLAFKLLYPFFFASRTVAAYSVF